MKSKKELIEDGVEKTKELKLFLAKLGVKDIVLDDGVYWHNIIEQIKVIYEKDTTLKKEGFVIKINLKDSYSLGINTSIHNIEK